MLIKLQPGACFVFICFYVQIILFSPIDFLAFWWVVILFCFFFVLGGFLFSLLFVFCFYLGVLIFCGQSLATFFFKKKPE